MFVKGSLFYCNTVKHLGTIFVLLFRICLYYKIFTFLIDTDAYSELSKTSKMEIVLESLKPVDIFIKS